MGIDRALALWGAVNRLGPPILVIDAGTALTFTGADARGQLVGGAILPGLGLQLRSLAEYTAALPNLFDRLDELRSIEALPSRWAIRTPDAILSGVLHTLLAGIHSFVQDWMQHYPDSTIVWTGGDSEGLLHHWQRRYPGCTWTIKAEPNLVFWGIQSVVAQRTL
jgi:type III pantothenate kinase